MPDRDAQFAWVRTERGAVTVTDRRAVLAAARACLERHGEPIDALPPRALVDGEAVPDEELQSALKTLLSCGHALDDMTGIKVDHANTLVTLSAWPPWPACEELDRA